MSAGLMGKASTSNTTSSALGAPTSGTSAQRATSQGVPYFSMSTCFIGLLQSLHEGGQFFIGPSIAYIAIRQGAKCRMAATTFDEMRSGPEAAIRAPYEGVARWLDSTSAERIAATRHEDDQFYRRHGITFGAYGTVEGAETTIPFDIIPRGIAWDEWQ